MTGNSLADAPSQWRADRTLPIDVAVLRNLEERLWWDERWGKRWATTAIAPSEETEGARATIETAKAVIGSMGDATPAARARTVCARLLRDARAKEREAGEAPFDPDAYRMAFSTLETAKAITAMLAERGSRPARG